MILSDEEVLHIAQLARLRMNLEEVGAIARQMNDILIYMEKLNKLDTSGVEPTSHAIPIYNVFRDDEVKPSFPHEEVLAIAPDEEDGHFKVPRIIE